MALICRSAEHDTPNPTGQEAPWRGSRITRTSWQKDPESGLWFPGVLLEPDRTQTARYTRDLNAWTKTRCTVPVGNASSPFGARGNVIHEDNTASNNHYVTALGTAALTSGNKYCYGVYLKADKRDYALAQVWEQAAGSVRETYVDLANGTLGYESNTNIRGIVDLGDDSYAWGGVVYAHNDFTGM